MLASDAPSCVYPGDRVPGRCAATGFDVDMAAPYRPGPTGPVPRIAPATAVVAFDLVGSYSLQSTGTRRGSRGSHRIGSGASDLMGPGPPGDPLGASGTAWRSAGSTRQPALSGGPAHSPGPPPLLPGVQAAGLGDAGGFVVGFVAGVPVADVGAGGDAGGFVVGVVGGVPVADVGAGVADSPAGEGVASGVTQAPGAGGSTGANKVTLPALAKVNMTGIAVPTSRSVSRPSSVGAEPSAM